MFRAVALLLALGTCVQGKFNDCTAEAGDYCIRTVGKSGKISMCPKNGTGDSDCIVVRLHKIVEYDTDGKEINSHRVNNPGSSMGIGAANHSFQFEKNCTEADRKGVPCGKNSDDNELRAVELPITAALGWADFDITTYMITQDGKLTFANETRDVKKGNFKFNINVKKYRPCGTTVNHSDCTQGQRVLIGESLKFEIQITAKDNKPMKPNGSTSVLETDDGTSRLVNFRHYHLLPVGESNWTQHDAHVDLDTKGNTQILTYKFPVGQAIAYDPLVSESPRVFAPVDDHHDNEDDDDDDSRQVRHMRGLLSLRLNASGIEDACSENRCVDIAKQLVAELDTSLKAAAATRGETVRGASVPWVCYLPNANLNVSDAILEDPSICNHVNQGTLRRKLRALQACTGEDCTVVAIFEVAGSEGPEAVAADVDAAVRSGAISAGGEVIEYIPNSVSDLGFLPGFGSSDGLSGGAIAGIVLGSIFGAMLAAMMTLYVMNRRRQVGYSNIISSSTKQSSYNTTKSTQRDDSTPQPPVPPESV
eukprot:Hpha_TRINITY_DN14879_c0_g1::TRINITY_DN14879_c0_g1_i1::g.169331::m.169331